LNVKDPFFAMETPLMPLGAFPFAVAAVTLKAAAS
jgi:hypothetical protein